MHIQGPDCVYHWVKCFIQNVVLRVSSRKNFKMFPYEAFFSCVFWEKCFSKSSSSMKPRLPWKISGCAPALRHYSFCKMLHLKCLTVVWIHLSWWLLSNLYIKLKAMYCIRHIQNSAILRTHFIQVYAVIHWLI